MCWAGNYNTGIVKQGIEENVKIVIKAKRKSAQSRVSIPRILLGCVICISDYCLPQEELVPSH